MSTSYTTAITAREDAVRVGTVAWANNVLAAEGVDPYGPFVDITDALQAAFEEAGVTNDDYTAEDRALALASRVAA